jgi:hypothetical protein
VNLRTRRAGHERLNGFVSCSRVIKDGEIADSYLFVYCAAVPIFEIAKIRRTRYLT